MTTPGPYPPSPQPIPGAGFPPTQRVTGTAALSPAPTPTPTPTQTMAASLPAAQGTVYGRQASPPAEPAAPGHRRLIIAGVIGTVILIAAIIAAIVLSGGGSADTFAVGSCVTQDGNEATAVSCTHPHAYRIVHKVDAVNKCDDQSQPYVVVSRRGSADEVLCLQPAR